MNIVHIGLGKTATTTLQKYVFPKAVSKTPYHFNAPEVMNLLRKSGGLTLSQAEKSELSSLLSNDMHFISLENLVNWNPAFWRWSADKNLEFFGPDATILITLREPLDWMTSMYQQVIHEGNVRKASEFFVSAGQYQALKALDSPAKIEYFCSDFFDYRALVRLYRERFKCVKVVDMRQIGSMDFLEILLDLTAEEKRYLKTAFHSAPHENRSYSARAMSLTLKREKLLRTFGLRTIGSNDRRNIDFLNLPSSQSQEPTFTAPTALWKRYASRLTEWRLPTWRGMMQVGIDRILPYKKFSLPEDVYINQDLLESNKAFLSKLRDEGHALRKDRACNP